MSPYPIYRKFKKRNVWAKVISDFQVVKVHTGGQAPDDDRVSISISCNSFQRSDAVDDRYSEPCTRQDFEKAYGEAMWKIVKTNDIQ